MAGPTLFRPSDISTGLVAYWKLDEASGSRSDSSGNGNTLSDNNTVGSVAYDYWNSSGTNSADFERANSEWLSITDGSQTGLDLNASDITFAVWFKSETAGAINPFISKGGSGYDLRITATNIIQFTKNTTSSNFTNAGVYAQRWYHLAVTHRNSDGQVCCYLNGKLTDVLTNADTISNNAFSVLVGDGQGTGNYWDGLLKDFGVWNVVLTPLQIKSLALGVDLSKNAYRPNRISNLVSYWKLNEIGTSTNRADSKGSNNLATSTTLTSAAGYGFTEAVGVDLELSNSESLRISDGSQTGLDITGNISMGAWIKMESDTTNQAIISKWATVGNQRGYVLYFRGADTKVLRLITSSDGTNVDGDVFSSVTLKAGLWYHVAATISGTTMSIYVDGLYVGGGTAAGQFNSSAYFMVGAYDGDGAGTPTNCFDGLIQDAFICNGALTAAEVASLAAGIPIQQTGIVSYWKLDETSGTRNDSIGSNSLTDNNTVLYGTGKVSNAADFELSNTEYLSMANHSSIDITRDMCVLGWFKPESININQKILDKDGSGDGYVIYVDTDEIVKFSTGGVGTTSGTGTVSVGTWTHCCGNHTGATREVYFNSEMQGTESSTAVPADLTEALRLGSKIDNTDYLDGLLDEVMLVARYFMEEEIKTVYIKGLNGKEATSNEIPVGGGFFLVF